MSHPKSSSVRAGLTLAVFSLLAFVAACHRVQKPTGDSTGTMPRPREVQQSERDELDRSIRERFGREAPPDAQYLAAGSFRFVNSSMFSYIDRSDTGSAAFEAPGYGVPDAAFDPASLDKQSLVARVDDALRRARLDAAGRRFANFEDEFVGTARPALLQPDFDPRQASKLVARTVSFEREIDGVPVFGSELLVGLMPKGDIGRLRMHWPTIERKVVDDARKLQATVRSQQWEPPGSIREDGAEILEMAAGVGHSGFADPAWKVAPVVRVLVRRVAAGVSPPLVSTSYRYFDASGREVRFSAFPAIPGTTRGEKPEERRY